MVKADVPFFRCNAILSIPNIVVSPGLDEVQMTLNRTVQMILSVFRSVSLWDNGLQRSKQFHSEGALSVVGTEPNTERRGSVTSNAPSEISRVDLGKLTYYPASFILSAHFNFICSILMQVRLTVELIFKWISEVRIWFILKCDLD